MVKPACSCGGLVAALVVALAGCSFDPSGLPAAGGDGGAADTDGPPRADASAAGDGDAGIADASTVDAVVFDAAIPIDAQCTIGFLDVCAVGVPGAPLDITGDRIIDTNTDPACRTYPQPGGPDACLILVEELSIGMNGSVTAIGSRPLIFASTTDIFIDGLLDVSSQRGLKTGAGANVATCSFTDTPHDDVGGAGGGAGGSFGGSGGNGGTGDTDTSLGLDGDGGPGIAGPTDPTPAFVRGGCRGQAGGDESGIGGDGGSGGDSGGAVHLLAFGSVTISATGSIRATGSGGSGGEVQAGGGGGGSGGYIGIDAAIISIGGPMSANSGGGGEGGGRINSSPVTGAPGGDGQMGTTPAPGGAGASSVNGDGGPGSAGLVLTGGPGVDSIVGAGGGGGGAGVIVLTGQVSGAGIVSPPATIN